VGHQPGLALAAAAILVRAQKSLVLEEVPAAVDAVAAAGHQERRQCLLRQLLLLLPLLRQPPLLLMAPCKAGGSTCLWPEPWARNTAPSSAH